MATSTRSGQARIDDTITTYLTAIEVERKTPRTIASYAQSLEDFRRVGRHSGLPEAVEEYGVDHVYAFLGDLRQRGAAPGYQNHRHREVRAFFSWCQRMGLVEENVFARIAYAAQEKKIYPPLSRDEARRLLDTQDRSRLKGCREYALILFLLDTGVRVAECLAVRLEDVDWEQGRVVGRQNLMRPTDTHDANLLAPACCRLAGSASAAPACVPAESRAPMTDAAASRFGAGRTHQAPAGDAVR